MVAFAPEVGLVRTRQTPLAVPELPRTELRRVARASDGNVAANEIADHVARFIPREDQGSMLQDEYGVRVHHAIQPALGYILSELVDNVFSHAAADDTPDPNAWIAVQTYPAGDLVRIAVADDGCGLLASLRAFAGNPPRNHFDAVRTAFRPFVSSKSVPGLYVERRHMGAGLAVCREICHLLGGRISAITGNAWVDHPLDDRETSRTTIGYSGTLVSLELPRRGVTSSVLRTALDRITRAPDLRLRFD